MHGDTWVAWYAKRVQRDGFESMVDIERKWCSHCLWWRNHSVHLEDIPHGNRRRYVCMHCAHQIVVDLMEGWYDDPVGARKTYYIEPGEDDEEKEDNK